MSICYRNYRAVQVSAPPLAAEAVSLIEKETLALCYKSMISYEY
jgi:hypothetical protein